MERINPNPAPAPGSSPSPFAEWLRGWRYFFWFLAVLLLVTLWCAEENWRGSWAWKRRQQEMKERGEWQPAQDFIPPLVPDQDNFAMTPVLASGVAARSLAGFKALASVQPLVEEYDVISRAARSNSIARLSSWAVPPAVDPAAWRTLLLKATNQTVLPRDRLVATNFTGPEAAQALLSALAGCAPIYDELHAASRRPESRFNIFYQQDDPASILLPHLAVVKQFSQLVLLRTVAELALGQSNAAFVDLELMLRLADATRTEPILVSQLVRMAQFQMAMPAILQGINQWSAPQLRELQDSLERIDFCADGARVLRAERTFFGDRMLEFVRRTPDKVGLMRSFGGFGGSGPSGLEFAALLMEVAPEGWFDLEHVKYNDMFQDYWLPTIDQTNHLFRPTATRRAEARLAAFQQRSASGLYLRHQLFCGLMLPSVTNVVQKLAFAQTAADAASLACALERYRRQHGQFPEALSQLVPDFMAGLPHDVISGQPLHYRRTPDGLYLLYSVGWNETDDGGHVALGRSGEVDRDSGDWVWRPASF